MHVKGIQENIHAGIDPRLERTHDTSKGLFSRFMSLQRAKNVHSKRSKKYLRNDYHVCLQTLACRAVQVPLVSAPRDSPVPPLFERRHDIRRIFAERGRWGENVT